MDDKSIIEKKYKFSTQYFKSPEDLKNSIINKTIIPHQVEFQPGPQGKKICWLSCPYCYGESAENNNERPNTERLVKILNDVADGGVNKVTFAGWATDPLNSHGPKSGFQFLVLIFLLNPSYSPDLQLARFFLSLFRAAFS